MSTNQEAYYKLKQQQAHQEHLEKYRSSIDHGGNISMLFLIPILFAIIIYIF